VRRTIKRGGREIIFRVLGNTGNGWGGHSRQKPIRKDRVRRGVVRVDGYR